MINWHLNDSAMINFLADEKTGWIGLGILIAIGLALLYILLHLKEKSHEEIT